MKLLPSDPDIQTIIARIKSDDLDLQPDFQRGEVWSDAKKRRLIDTILRDWHIPPIHVIERPDSHKQEVLDGQQRLVAIRDFVNGLIRVDGMIEPVEMDLVLANNSTYETLPPNLRRRFDRFTIRIFRLVDFNPDEPGELFFRLNQPTSLTSAEQRNAFFGPVRHQVREICEHFPSFGLSDEILGFSNSRMAFDDIVGKLCVTIERGTFRQKITAVSITERYRQADSFKPEVAARCKNALRIFGKCSGFKPSSMKFNKATLYSWLCFFSKDMFAGINEHTMIQLADFMIEFEKHRTDANAKAYRHDMFQSDLLAVFTDRASLRVGDVSSVMLRDSVIAYTYIDNIINNRICVQHKMDPQLFDLHKQWHHVLETTLPVDEGELFAALDRIGWGSI